MKDPCEDCKDQWSTPTDSCNNHCSALVIYLVRTIDRKCDELKSNVTVLMEKKNADKA